MCVLSTKICLPERRPLSCLFGGEEQRARRNPLSLANKQCSLHWTHRLFCSLSLSVSLTHTHTYTLYRLMAENNQTGLQSQGRSFEPLSPCFSAGVLSGRICFEERPWLFIFWRLGLWRSRLFGRPPRQQQRKRQARSRRLFM